MPLFVPTSEPTAGGFGLQFPVSAALIWEFSEGGVGVPDPFMFTHAAVLLESTLPLLVMNLIVLPQPPAVNTWLFWKGQLLRPIGKTHVFGGGSAGGLATAMAEADTGSV